jgi:hypothetical protein
MTDQKVIKNTRFLTLFAESALACGDLGCYRPVIGQHLMTDPPSGRAVMSLRRVLSVSALATALVLPNAARASEEFFGALFGATAGALLGKAIGGGDGAVVGGLLGAAVGASNSARAEVPAYSYHPVAPPAPAVGLGYGYGVTPAPVYPVQPYTWYSAPPPPVYYAPPVVVAPPVVYGPPRVYAPAPRVVITPPPVYVRPPHYHAPRPHYQVHPGGAVHIERVRPHREYRREYGHPAYGRG